MVVTRVIKLSKIEIAQRRVTLLPNNSFKVQFNLNGSSKEDIINKTDIMAKRDSKETIEELQMKEKIKHLEQALVNSELRATALEMMIEVAEKELKINIRKKSNTKPSSK